MMILSNINLVQLWESGGPFWFLAGVILVFIPKILEWFRSWKKDATESTIQKRQNLLERLTTMEEIISQQQNRYMLLHSQLIQERETSQDEKMSLQKKIFDLEVRVNILEKKLLDNNIDFEVVDNEGGEGI